MGIDVLIVTMPCQDERRRGREAESDGDIAGCGRKRGARVCEGSAANIVYYVLCP